MAMPILIEEAKASDKICPLSISAGVRPVGCLGKTCAAWRFGTTHIKNEAGNDTERSDDTHGYCGLAGVPGQLFG